MFKVVSNGYEMEDGVVVPFDANLSEIQPEYIASMNKENSSTWDSFIFHRELLELKNTITGNQTVILNKIDSLNNIHPEHCPIEPNRIKLIVCEEIEEKLKSQKNSIRSFFRDVILITTTMGGLFALFKLFGA